MKLLFSDGGNRIYQSDDGNDIYVNGHIVIRYDVEKHWCYQDWQDAVERAVLSDTFNPTLAARAAEYCS